MDYREAIETLHNGNIEDFRSWLKKAKKSDILDAIEYAQSGGYYSRHILINKMRMYLESEGN